MSMDDSELRELARQAADGDPDAAERLITGFHRYLMVSLHLSGVPERDIDDVAQNVALQVYRSLRRYSPEKPFLPWMRGVASHVVKNYWRTESRKRTREDRFRDYVEQRMNNERTMRILADSPSDRLQVCIRKLPERQQKMLVMHYTQGLRAKEIGTALKQTATAIHKALSRIREALRACMEEPVPKPAR